jgi:hypothetical protein
MTGRRTHLVALSGGPKDGWWYWLEDWNMLVDSTRAQKFPVGHPANTVLHYQPTGRRIAHRTPLYSEGEVWTYQPPAGLPPAREPAAVTPDPPRPCVQCGNPILLRRPGRDQCSRCHPVGKRWVYIPARHAGVPA